MTIEYVTIGEVTIDDTVLETGQLMRAQTGGGTVYSALGIRLWNHITGINAVVGKEYPKDNLRILESHSVSTEGITRIDGWSLRLWLLHEENNKKQQFPKLQSSTFKELDDKRADPPDSYWQAQGYHLAPATPEGQIRSRDIIRQRRPNTLISLDILTEPFIQFDSYRNGSALKGIDIFSPSIVEIETLWPGIDLEGAIRFISSNGVRWIAIKMDTRGSIVYDTEKNEEYRIPIFPSETVDTTGAGDAYSGGFLEGIAETGNVLEAGIRGTVSASFAVEDWGAFGLLEVAEEEVNRRKNWLQNQAELC
jgi:sugar/nucleoside kinase (ribokinase family)